MDLAAHIVVNKSSASTLNVEVNNHPHLLEHLPKLGTSWHCDGCKAQFSSKTCSRYRCVQCDFDLCAACILKYATHLATVSVHAHPLILVTHDNGWACDARKLAGGCRSGITGFDLSKGIERWRCEQCDFDLCNLDIEQYLIIEQNGINETVRVLKDSHPLVLIKKPQFSWTCDSCKAHCTSLTPTFYCHVCNYNLCVSCLAGNAAKKIMTVPHIHPHALVQVNCDNGWACDARKLPSGCKRGITDFNQSKSVERWRCQLCDFDLCDLDATTYNVQNLSLAPAPVSNKTLNTEDECCVCMEREKCAVFLPCSHLSCCLECAQKLQSCPTCRGTINSVIRIFKS